MIDFRSYIDAAERCLRLVEDSDHWQSQQIMLVPSIILSWSAIESFVNNRLDDLGSLPDGFFELHERAFLFEKRLEFANSGEKAGQFTLGGSAYQKLEDKVLFLLAKTQADSGLDMKSLPLWNSFQELKNDRDALVHPRSDREVVVNIEVCGRHLETAKEIIRFLANKIWGHKSIL